MTEFIYLAVNPAGKEKKGNVEAEDRTEAIQKIKAIGLIPIDIRRANLLNREINLDLGRKVKPRDLSLFCRQFVSMINAGVTIVDALGMLSEQTENKKMKAAIRDVQADIEKGETMSTAMAAQTKVFPKIMISMVEAGEASGKLDTTFRRMAEHFEKEAKLKALIRKASIYPAIVGLVAIAIIVVMLVVIIPNYSKMFTDMAIDLPAITVAAMHASDFVIQYWYLLLAGIVLTVMGIRAYFQTTPGQIMLGTILRKLPLLGKLNVKMAASSFARTLSTLTYSGLPMIESLEIVSHTMTNALYRKAVMEAREDVMRGIPLSEPIKRCRLFPPMVGHMTSIGEETGDLEEMLNKLADYYDEEVEMTTQTVMAALEPMIVLTLSTIVGLLIAIVMAPMIKLYGGMDSL